MTESHLFSLLSACLKQAGLRPNDEGACAVLMDDGMDLDIQVTGLTEELRLTLPLGQAAAGDRRSVLLQALMSNSLLANTSNRHLAWESSRGRLVMCHTLRFDQIEAANFCQHLEEFSTACRALRQQLAHAGIFQP